MNGHPVAGLLNSDADATIDSNHTRLASTDFGLHAHFGGFFFFGVAA